MHFNVGKCAHAGFGEGSKGMVLNQWGFGNQRLKVN